MSDYPDLRLGESRSRQNRLRRLDIDFWNRQLATELGIVVTHVGCEQLAAQGCASDLSQAEKLSDGDVFVESGARRLHLVRHILVVRRYSDGFGFLQRAGREDYRQPHCRHLDRAARWPN